MGDRFAMIVVSLLVLIALCGMILAGIKWVPSQFDRLDDRISRLESIGPQIAVMTNQVQKLGELEGKLSRTTSAVAPLGRIDTSVGEIVQKLNEVVKGVNGLKANTAMRTDFDRLLAKFNEKFTDVNKRLGGTPKASAELKSLMKQVADLKSLVSSTRKDVNTRTKAITKDLKKLQLDVQKLSIEVRRIKESSGSTTAS